MTDEEIRELAEICGVKKRWDENLYKCREDQLLKFAQEIRKQTIDEVLTLIKDVPNPEANWTAINRILNKYYD
jgi:primosomal protein N''